MDMVRLEKDPNPINSWIQECWNYNFSDRWLSRFQLAIHNEAESIMIQEDCFIQKKLFAGRKCPPNIGWDQPPSKCIPYP